MSVRNQSVLNQNVFPSNAFRNPHQDGHAHAGRRVRGFKERAIQEKSSDREFISGCLFPAEEALRTIRREVPDGEGEYSAGEPGD